MKYEFTGEVKIHFGITLKQIRRIADHKGTKHEAVYKAAIAMARAQLDDAK